MNAIWIPVVSAFLASVFSLLIAWFTNCWNERRFNKQLKHEREKDSKKLLISQGLIPRRLRRARVERCEAGDFISEYPAACGGDVY
ncbi:hypothetical protein [Xenorhabdus sp. KJ12.1]|uniref:hypothetical protein n=1 Tax=Xenorhabdus sp. KJ12.1 TaxID=1851571 RepID=UPI000C04F27F|nr:hypothetical protein [Xenorhabdus sp. KJ12.1]PHM65726.1 hypothetical protein Xekj_04228 [Xenorhabdus sp. KJ12.1]